MNENKFYTWSQGYGCIKHEDITQQRVKALINQLAIDMSEALHLCMAADRVANAAMWLVVHQVYAQKVNFDGRPLQAEDFKDDPQGHLGGSLNMVPAYVGYMLANALSGKTDSWIMGQGHCVAAIDSVNLVLDNMLPEHAARYSWSETGLTRFCQDFYSYKLNEKGLPDSPLGSHVNIHTAGGSIEGGYLGFAELQYMHMPLPGEYLVAFLSDGAFEEQRGSDWGAHWWRGQDTGIVTPIMIFNGRRIDQRSLLSQEAGLPAFIQHLKNYHYDPITFDGTDPAAFACTILECQSILLERARKNSSYPLLLPYGIAVAKKGAGFYGEGTNAAHNLPLGKNLPSDAAMRTIFNQYAQKLFVPREELQHAKRMLNNHDQSMRFKEREHNIANRKVEIGQYPKIKYLPIDTISSPMAAIDDAFIAYLENNPSLRPRVGNPDEILSNHLPNTLAKLKHRVTEVEIETAEAIDGKIITALNEEAVACACLANKAGINLIVTYEAFAPKMLGAIRQEITWSDHLENYGKQAGWISVPLILTSHTYENGKNERSHQDPSLCEALLHEPSNISRVLFPADYNSAVAALDACYQTHGRIFTLVIPKTDLPVIFTETQATQLIRDGIIRIQWQENAQEPQIILTAVGAYQLHEIIKAAQKLSAHGYCAAINYIIEPSRFSQQIPKSIQEQYFPADTLPRVFVSHTHPEVISGILRALDTRKNTRFLGFINKGGTLNTQGMLKVNQQSCQDIVKACESLGIMPLSSK